MKRISLIILLIYASLLSAQCFTATNGENPSYVIDSFYCDGITPRTLCSDCKTGQFSLFQPIIGETYTFYSTVATDLITISDYDETTVFASGVGSVTWTANTTAYTKFFTHLNDGACGSSTDYRARKIICGIPPTCIYPSGIVFSSITPNSATFSWTASLSNPTNGYEYYYSTSPIAPIKSTIPSGSVPSGITTVDLTGLLPGNVYFVWLRAVNDVTDKSEWVSAHFSTVCDLVTDFIENFDARPDLPPCWSVLGSAGGSSIKTSTDSSSLNNYLSIYGYTSSPLTVLINRLSNSGSGTHQLRFKARGAYYTGGKLSVGYLTDPDNPLSFVSVQTFTITSATVFEEYVANLGVLPGGFHLIAFKNSDSIEEFIDDVVWEPISSCSNPIALSTNAITPTTAVISWADSVNPSGNGYEYYISTNSMPPTETTVPSGSVTAGNLMASITGLTPETQYFFWLRSVCSSTETSVWSNMGYFGTMCENATALPYLLNFDTTLAPNFPLCTTTENIGAGSNWIMAHPLYGSSWGCLQYDSSIIQPANAWFFTNAVYLTANTHYNICYKYTTSNMMINPTWPQSFNVACGNAPDASAMTIPLAQHMGVMNSYQNGFTPKTILFTPTETGDYYFGFQATTSNSAGELYIDNILISSNVYTDVTPTPEPPDSKSIAFYPNPVNDILKIETGKAVPDVSIYNLMGQEVKTNIDMNQSQINVANLPKGNYLVRITVTGGLTKTIKMIKK